MGEAKNIYFTCLNHVEPLLMIKNPMRLNLTGLEKQ